jgi:serine/threonine protein kinase
MTKDLMPEPLPADTVIAHYRILTRLGAGGMGEVYLAEDTRLGRKVALKLLPAQFTQDADRGRRLRGEGGRQTVKPEAVILCCRLA